MKIKIKKMSFHAGSNLCILPLDIFTALDLNIKTQYTIHFGLSTETTLVGFLETEERNMYFSEGLFTELQLLQDITLSIRKENNELYIGPVVGLLTNCSFMPHATMPGREASSYARSHLEGGLSQNCLSYFFCINDANLPAKKIWGLTWIPEENKPDYAWFPLPEVIYVKNVNITKELKEFMNRCRETYKIKFINNCTMLGKWELCEALRKYPEAKIYVPETILYKNFQDVLSMLNKHGFIFLKSFYGLGGKEVLSIEKLEDGDGYKLNYSEGSAKELLLPAIKDLEAFVIKYAKRARFVVQQGIRLLKYKDRTIDVRFLMMKNLYGQWESIYKLVRVARRDFSITTAAGKSLAIYEKIHPWLQEEYAPTEIPDLEKLDQAAAVLCRYIERDFGAMGEIGMDIGIDIHGQIWIIEANSDPFKNMSYNVHDLDGELLADLILKYYKGSDKERKILPQAAGIFKYARFLTGYNQE